MVDFETLFNYLLETGGPEQKTIIFCARDQHAGAVAIALNNLYHAWCAAQGVVPVEPYAFKCTAASAGGESLPDFRGSANHHIIAATVDLLTTGVDVPAVENVVFFKYVKSPISFYQMVGRGTRLNVPTGKLMFRVYDYTDATRLFGEEFTTRRSQVAEKPGAYIVEGAKQPVIQVEGLDVYVTPAGRYIVTTVDGKATPVTVEEYKQRLAARLIEQAPSLESFRERWIAPDERRRLLQSLPGGSQSARVVREIEGLENPRIFQTPEVVQAGGLNALKAIGTPRDVLQETKARMFAA